MPTTPSKNLLYRASLPFLAPRCGLHPLRETVGTPLCTEKRFLRLMRRHHVLGSATLLSFGEETSLMLTESSAPEHVAREGTLFRVASITKLATALVTMILADQDRVLLDVPVSYYLPEKDQVSSLAGITLRHLLSHTSGLIDPPDLESAVEDGQPYTILSCREKAGPPGTVFRYSNFGFGLIGCVIEAVCEQPVSRVFQQLVFDPLEMNATLDASVLPESSIMPVTRILPWQKGRDLVKTTLGRQSLTEPDPLRHYGHTAGSMYTDIRSLEKLMRCLQDRGAPLIRSDIGKQMTEEHASYGAVSPTLRYGLGMLMIKDPLLSSSRILGHQGFAYGCADGAFWEEQSGALLIHLNGGASEARTGRLGLLNRDLLLWALTEELPVRNGTWHTTGAVAHDH